MNAFVPIFLFDFPFLPSFWQSYCCTFLQLRQLLSPFLTYLFISTQILGFGITDFCIKPISPPQPSLMRQFVLAFDRTFFSSPFPTIFHFLSSVLIAFCYVIKLPSSYFKTSKYIGSLTFYSSIKPNSAHFLNFRQFAKEYYTFVVINIVSCYVQPPSF